MTRAEWLNKTRVRRQLSGYCDTGPQVLHSGACTSDLFPSEALINDTYVFKVCFTFNFQIVLSEYNQILIF